MARLVRVAAAGAALAALACSGLGAPPPTPSPKAELVLGLSPTRASEGQVAAAQQLAGILSGLVRVPVVVRAEPSAAALDADLAAGRVDAAWSDSLTYVALRQRHPFTPVLRGARCFPTYTPNPPAADCTPQPGTPAIIICGATSAVPELTDGGDWSILKGRRFAFEDPTSLPGYVWPRYFLAKNRVNPDSDLTKGPPTPSDVAVALAVYNGIADCGALQGDGRAAGVPFAPDIFDRTKVVFVAPGNVPGDVVYTGSHLNSAQARALREGLLKLGITAAASPAIQQLTGGSTSMLVAGEHDFDLLRATVAAENPRLLESVFPPSPTATPSLNSS